MIPLFMPSFDESDVEAVSAAIRSGWLIEHSRTKEFSEKFAEYVGREYAVPVSSGTAALFSSLKASGLKRGGRVAVPDFTALGSITAVHLAGGIPILVDVDDYGNIDVDSACKSDVSHVIVVHNNGHRCDLDRLVEHFGCRYVIEDACQGLGSTDPNGKQMGADTDIGCFSLSSTKIITAGQGGVVVTDDEKLYVTLQRLKNQGNFKGHDEADTHVHEGYNFTWTDMSAALALSQLRRLPDRVRRMREIVGLYNECGDIPIPPLGELPWRVLVKVPSEKRDSVVSHLRENGVGARAFFKPLHTHFGLEGFPNAVKYSSSGICLPSYPHLTDEQVKYVCDTFKEAKQ